ncbi:MAG: ABC transporter permease subunit [Acidobacteria bacterium]|nr:ABC transporter permease subunit [Acidobacteriota bacterium]
MRNILTIAQKELRSYFVSPMAYVAIGFFVFIYGYFFVVSLNFMVRVSMQAGMMGGPQTININEYMMRPLLGNMAVVMLFLLPALTGRSYAEEKRSGTIELLLSSPLTGPQIILGKYFGALALFTLMLAVTLIHVGVLFIYGEPELGPILSGYLGLWLMGGAFISVGLLISSMTKNQTVAVMGAFGTALMLWIVSWIGDPSSGSTTTEVLAYLSILDHFDDFSKGVIDTKHLAYYLSFITFGLFLTARSVDSERWRG